MTMKLYAHPISNASRPVLLFIAENKLPVETHIVDLAKGEHHSEWFSAINPSRLVPVLEDGDLKLTECSAILKYLAAKFELASYPKDLKKRARVDEMMDWFNTQFYRDFGYGLAYPQLFPHHARATTELTDSVVTWGRDKAANWFKVLDTHFLGGGKSYVANNELSIADYLGVSFVTIGDLLRCDFSHYPNVTKWIGRMKGLSSWNQVNEVFYGFAGMMKDKPFKAITP